MAKTLKEARELMLCADRNPRLSALVEPVTQEHVGKHILVLSPNTSGHYLPCVSRLIALFPETGKAKVEIYLTDSIKKTVSTDAILYSAKNVVYDLTDDELRAAIGEKINDRGGLLPRMTRERLRVAFMQGMLPFYLREENGSAHWPCEAICLPRGDTQSQPVELKSEKEIKDALSQGQFVFLNQFHYREDDKDRMPVSAVRTNGERLEVSGEGDGAEWVVVAQRGYVYYDPESRVRGAISR